MARYEIEISRTAERQLRRLTRADQQRIARAILTLAIDPFPRGARKLAGYDDVHRIRIGSYRVLYSVSTTTLIVIVLKVGHRKDVYQ
ncbi:MAG: type II toxin-antitoxin system RelE/ParE family toxin [Gammaproteobacteria bacterium]|nr:type II toxin-antitoxin system RelE/ParE family toxin [Gammaproteobacteria bacterium]